MPIDTKAPSKWNNFNFQEWEQAKAESRGGGSEEEGGGAVERYVSQNEIFRNL